MIYLESRGGIHSLAQWRCFSYDNYFEFPENAGCVTRVATATVSLSLCVPQSFFPPFLFNLSLSPLSNPRLCMTSATTSATTAPWSNAYKEEEDTFAEFQSHVNVHGPNSGGGIGPSGGSSANLGGAGEGGLGRQPSARQLSGQLEDIVERQWEADWDDEDTDDTFQSCMEKIQLHSKPQGSTAAAARKAA